MSRRGLAALAALIGLACADVSARAADYDFDDATTWNGIGYLLTTAEEAKVEVEVLTHLDLAELDPDDVLMWLYPLEEPPVEALLTFVSDGGHLIVADDFGASGPLLDALGVTRQPGGPAAHERWYGNEDGLPILRRDGREHFLFFNVEEIVANHPAVLTGAGVPLISFGGGDGNLVVERRIGAGAVLLIADPSMFLNQMLRRFYGNKQLAANVMRLYCRQEPCAVKILSPAAALSGEYAGGSGHLGALPRLIERAAESIDEALGELSASLSEPPWAVIVALAVLTTLGALASLVLAFWRRPLRAPPVAAGVAGTSPVVTEAVGLAAARADADFYDLAATLAAYAEDVTAARQLEAYANGARRPPRGEDMETVQVLRHALLRVKRDAASLRSGQPPVISAERFARLYDDVQTLNRFGSAPR